MLLSEEKSKCEKNQKIIVSRDKGSSCCHRALNINGCSDVRQYRLDGELVIRKTCCDYLVLNDTKQNAYFIELKGSDIKTAISQLESAEKICAPELRDYSIFYRIIAKKVCTHDVKSNKFRKFQDQYGRKLKCATEKMEEDI